MALVAALAAGGCELDRAAAEPRPPRFEAGRAAETNLLRRSLWDDGQAEVAAYDTRERRYGTLRDGQAVLVAVKEGFDAERLVKAEGAEPPRHPVTVIKLNTLVTVPTGVYTYRQMASSFLTREHARPVKLAVSSQEWCGTTYKQLAVRGDDALLRLFSYFGDEGERAFRIPLDDRTVLGDALPLWVRTLDLKRTEDRHVRIIDEQLSNRAPAPRVRKAVVRIGPPRELRVPAGRFEAVPVQVRRGEHEETFWLRSDAQHTLVRWDRADGGAYRLRWIKRAPYWQMNRAKDVGALDPRRLGAGDRNERELDEVDFPPLLREPPPSEDEEGSGEATPR